MRLDLVLILAQQSHVQILRLLAQLFEGGTQVALEIIPAETELLVTLVSRHLEDEKVLLSKRWTFQ